MEVPRETLLQLLELQKIDSTIDRLEARKRNLPEQAELNTLEESHIELEKAVAEQQAVVDEIVARHKKMDGDVDLIGEKIRSEEEKLYSGDVANPRELSNLQAEVESLKRRKTSLEDEELEVMEEREKAEKELSQLSDQLDEVRQNIDETRGRRDRASADIDKQLAEARTGRGDWSPRFEQELLDFYDDLRGSKGGVAIAALVDGTCQGCNMRLPAQEVERIRAAEGIAYCDECRRVLVVH